VETFSQIANDFMLPSEHTTPWAPRSYFYFRGSIPGPHVPLSTLRPHSYPYTRMTRGQYGLLLLYCKRLSLSVTHRFAPAHRGVKILKRAETIAATSAEYERAHGAIFRVAKIRMFAQTDSLRPKDDSQVHQAIPSPLSHRTLPPGARQFIA
jgi:hypothetical protein